MKQIGWHEANKNKRSVEWLCPEWLWFSIFILALSAIMATAVSITRFNPETAGTAQLSPLEVKTPSTRQEMAKKGVVGVASWYDYSLNGIEWSKDHDTCATRDFKRYSTIRVTNLENGKSVDCFINDYGPELGQIPERHVDLSSHAFNQIADLKLGLINVKIEEL